MKLGSKVSWQAVKAVGAGAALMSLMSAAYPQSGPFAGFDGTWSGKGTVTFSDGATERIRCKAQYKVDGAATGLQQSLRCASDGYKFDLSSDVTSQTGSVSGTWSEATRNINGTLRGRVTDGRINVIAEAAGFAATLTMATHGGKQSVSISSDGEIRGVSITMVRG
jgi:hypothetical protein